jgi:hypothetical protein
VCSPSSASRNASYCELSERCVRSVAVTDEVDATIVRARYVSCQNNGTGRLSCYCDDGRAYEIQGQDGTQACDTLLDVCGNPEVLLDGPVTCVPDLQSTGIGHCQTQQRCSQTLEIDGGVIAVTTGIRAASCQSTLDGGSMCNCYDEKSSMRFSTELPTSDVSTCNKFADDCASAEDLGLNGPIECAPSYQAGDATYCNANIECSQAGTLAGEAIRAYGSLSAYCQPLNGAWSCNCASGFESATVEVSASTGWDACTEVVDLCPEVVEVQIGQDAGIGMPIPL